jgi:hypothetical protein
MKLIEKTRIGSRVRRRYDKAKTPYQRLIELSQVSDVNKQQLNDEYTQLNPVTLKREIEAVKARLWKQTKVAI